MNEREREQEYTERVMTMHWDMAACPCGLCQWGRSKGWGAKEKYLPVLAPARPGATGGAE